LHFTPPPCTIAEDLQTFVPVAGGGDRLLRRSSLSSSIHADDTPAPTLQSTALGPHNMLGNVTVKLCDVFHGCNPAFRYDRAGNPRRVLTKPGRPTHNNGWDNEKWDYILYVNDTLGDEEGRRYTVIDLLGQGTFGQVAKCQNQMTRELVAVKVIKNQPAYYNQSMMEVTVLEMLNGRYDRDDTRHIVRLRDTFVFRGHLCIVVELLSVNLYELIKQNAYKGFSLKLCRILLAQILDALCVLREARIVHCDLKPENVLLKSLDRPAVKVIDFGSACHEHQTVYTYIQSRFYRSPEVLLGLPYSASIDMWSLGCIAAELFLGLPVFPGASNYDQVARIVETLGLPPFHMLEVGKDTNLYFERTTSSDDYARPQYRLKSRERFSMEQGRPEPPSKRYFASTDLEEVIMNYPSRQNQPADLGAEDQRQRQCFLHFVRGLLTVSPVERWSPLQAINHPFITGQGLEAALPANTATTTTTSPISMRTQNRARPRANTLATLSLQDVPGPLQKLAAVNQGAAAPPGGPTDYRYIPESVSSPSTLAPSALCLNDYSGSLGSMEQSNSSKSTLTNTTANSSSTNSETFNYTNRYVDNRRVSNPAISILNAPPTQPPSHDQLAATSLPSWYNPATSKRSPHITKRRDSMEGAAMPNSPLANVVGSPAVGTARTRRKSVNVPSSPSMSSINESEGH
jgi:serine/threonine protein kinase